MARGQFSYKVDIVFCIDATSSMKKLIAGVKENANSFHKDLSDMMNVQDKFVDELRVRVIVYRDYWADGNDAMQQSPFLLLPDENEHYTTFVNSIVAKGGGDEPENGLEALAVAINSDWTEGDARRQVIVLWSDAPAHPLEKPSKPSTYPLNMPSSLSELTDLYESADGPMDINAKRIVVFAPDAYPWKEIKENWDKSVFFAAAAGKGLEERSYKAILELIARSI